MRPVTHSDELVDLEAVDRELRFAAFGQNLRGAAYTGQYDFDNIIRLAQGAKGEDPFGYRAEFLNLARLVKAARPVAFGVWGCTLRPGV